MVDRAGNTGLTWQGGAHLLDDAARSLWQSILRPSTIDHSLSTRLLIAEMLAGDEIVHDVIAHGIGQRSDLGVVA